MKYFTRKFSPSETIHNNFLDIFIGENSPVGEQFTEFQNESELKAYLLKGDFDRIQIFKSRECPERLCEEIFNWVSTNLSLNNIG